MIEELYNFYLNKGETKTTSPMYSWWKDKLIPPTTSQLIN